MAILTCILPITDIIRDVHLGLIDKCVVDFPSVLIGLFLARAEALRGITAKIDHQFVLQFRVEGVAATNNFYTDS